MTASALRLAIMLIAIGCLWLFFAHPWWFPRGVTAQAADLDRQFRAAFLMVGALFFSGQLLLAFLLRQNRKPGASGSRLEGWQAEVLWTLAVAAIFFWFNVSATHLWSRMIEHSTSHKDLQVEVTGVQFQWYFRYPGADLTFGRVNAQKFARADEGNPLGLDPADPAGKDDIVSSALVLPAGREAELILRAQDVIHSVFIPAMRLKQDAVPGMEIHTHVKPLEIGTYELTCSQLCGLGHYHMRAAVRVVSADEFNQWLTAHKPN
jgi:cytochrome c oxidase subunit 2